jgi:hypothetical protein
MSLIDEKSSDVKIAKRRSLVVILKYLHRHFKIDQIFYSTVSTSCNSKSKWQNGKK